MSDHETLFPPLPPVDPEAWKERLDDWPIPPVPDPRTAEERLRVAAQDVVERFDRVMNQPEGVWELDDEAAIDALRAALAAEPVPVPEDPRARFLAATSTPREAIDALPPVPEVDAAWEGLLLDLRMSRTAEPLNAILARHRPIIEAAIRQSR